VEIRWLGRWLVVALALGATAAGAQGVGFLTEQQRLASYCAGVSEARMRDMSEFLSSQCANSTRRECGDTAESLQQAKVRDRRLWDYLTRNIFTSREQGPREKALAQKTIAKGNDDWLTCKRRGTGQGSDQPLICRETQGCLIDARFGFLDQ
jgi:hypothetical protein